MVESWMIQLRLEEKEKKELMDFYKRESISASGNGEILMKKIMEDWVLPFIVLAIITAIGASVFFDELFMATFGL